MKQELNGAIGSDEILSLFKNKQDFESEQILESVKSGQTSCELVVNQGKDISNQILPWPLELKNFLAEEIMALPENLRDLAVKSVSSIFLLKKKALVIGDNGAIAAGLACDMKGSRQGVLFLNEFTYVTDRKRKGSLSAFQEYKLIPANTPYMSFESGDNAAITLIHEIFHAIDNKFYQVSNDPRLRNLRREAQQLSWQDAVTPIYPAFASGLALVGESIHLDRALHDKGEGCRPHKIYVSEDNVESFQLLTFSPNETARELRRLAEETNFIVPYTVENQAEDFAESLAVYYFGAYRNSWQVRKVFDRDITNGRQENAKLIYEANTQSVLKTVPKQQEKICVLADLAFGDNPDVCKERILGRLRGGIRQISQL